MSVKATGLTDRPGFLSTAEEADGAESSPVSQGETHSVPLHEEMVKQGRDK